MIGPISFLWKQLNGPQITAFTKSVYNWAVDEFDRSLEYLNNLSISTANSKHLSFLGMLANFSRPFIRKLNLSLFFFTESPQSNFVHGFSSLEDVGVGGKVVALEQLYETMENEPLKDSVYRELLLEKRQVYLNIFTASGSTFVFYKGTKILRHAPYLKVGIFLV